MYTGKVRTDIVAATVYSEKPSAKAKNAENNMEPRIFGRMMRASVVQVSAPRLAEASKYTRSGMVPSAALTER